MAAQSGPPGEVVNGEGCWSNYFGGANLGFDSANLGAKSRRSVNRQSSIEPCTKRNDLCWMA